MNSLALLQYRTFLTFLAGTFQLIKFLWSIYADFGGKHEATRAVATTCPSNHFYSVTRERLNHKNHHFKHLAPRVTVTKSVQRDRFGTLMMPHDGVDTSATAGRAAGLVQQPRQHH